MRKYLQPLIPLSIAAVVYLVFHIIGIGCPIKFISGISCPGCGMSRAWLWALLLDFESAFYFHPLFWAVPIFPVLFILNRAGKLSHKKYDLYLIIVGALFIIVWLVRMFSGGDVVIFSPEEGIFVRIFKMLFS